MNRKKIYLLVMIALLIIFICWLFARLNVYSVIASALGLSEKTEERMPYTIMLFAILIEIGGYFLAHLTELAELYFNRKDHREETACCINIRVLNTTTLRKGYKHGLPEIVIGTGASFIYITACIECENMHQVNMCTIRDKDIKTDSSFYFRVCTENDSFEDSYTLPISYKDDFRNRHYSGTLGLTLVDGQPGAYVNIAVKRVRKQRRTK